MSLKDAVLSRFSGSDPARPVFMPDLGVWYRWHNDHDSFPDRWRGKSQSDIHRDLSTPIWHLVRPWKVESTCPISESVTPDKKTLSIDAGRLLTAQWVRGPDGDWWQTEYLAKTEDDLAALLSFVQSRRFETDPGSVKLGNDEVGDDGVVVVDLPARPFSWLMLECLGWSDGLMLLLDSRELVEDIVQVANGQIQSLVSELAGSAELFYSPDNLDAQFVSPSFFADFIASSYAETTARLAETGAHLIVHAGGPVRPLLGPLAAAGVRAVAGICGPPQGDATLSEARENTGADVVLMGGIPQDVLLPNVEESVLHDSMEAAFLAATADHRAVIAIADHVPIEADPDRLMRVAERFAQ